MTDSGAERVVPALGQLALLRGMITQAQLDAALAEQAKPRAAGQRIRPLGDILVAQGALDTAQLAPLLQDVNAVSAAGSNLKPSEDNPVLPKPAATTAPAPAPAAADKPKKASSPNLASQPDKPAKTASSPHLPTPKAEEKPSSDSESKTRRKSPTPFGKYSILKEIGRGGKGVVQEALDTVLDRKVALKTIHSDSGIDPKEVEAEGRRFLAEARISASLPKHPHIVSVYEAGEIDGRRYLAMELIQGQSMMRWRRMSGITIAQQAALIRDIALALDLAHKAGVVHRDIKPQNILVDKENQPHLTDFGLAKVTGQKEDLANTVPGKVWGTPVYMSPEHAKGLASLDHRADVYSLGILLYEAIAGRPPFRSDKPSEILDKLVHDPVPPVGKFVEQSMMTPLQRALEPVCVKALAKSPAQRHGSAREFAAEIDRCLGGEEAAPRKKKMAVWAGAAAAAVLLAGVAIFAFSGSSTVTEFAAAQRLMDDQKTQEALAAYDRVLAIKPDHEGAIEGKKAALKRLTVQREAEIHRAAEKARLEERARSEANEEELKRRSEAQKRATEEETLAQQAQLLKEKRDAEERARILLEEKKKAEERLAAKPDPVPAPSPVPKPAPAPTPPPTPAPAPAPNPPNNPAGAVLVAAPTGEPKELEDGILHFEAEDYSGGAAPKADIDYSDASPGNSGRAYRPTSDVDVYPIQDGGFVVLEINPNEWLHYTFHGTGRFQVEIHYQNRQNPNNPQPPPVVHLEIDGVNVSGGISLPAGTERRGWGTAIAYLPALPPGKHDLRFVFDTRLDALDWFRLKSFIPAPVPDASALRDAEKLIHDAFKADYARKTPADLLALAKKLQAEAAKPQKEAAVHYALLVECRDVAAQSGDAPIALAAIEELDRHFAVDLLALKAETLAATMKGAKTTDSVRGVAEAYIPLIELLVDRDDYEAALLLCPKAETAAKASQSPNLLTRIQQRTKEVTSLRDEFRNLKGSLKALETNPADPAANLAVGLYRCFAKGDWTHGAPMLAKGSDAALAALGQKETSTPPDATAQVALADGWREAGEKRLGTLKTRLLSRALHWYEKALPDIPGLMRVKIESHVETLTKAVYGGSDVLRKNLVFWVEPSRDPQDPYREYVSGSRVQNNGSTIVDSGAKAIQFNIGPTNRGWIEYPAVEAVKTIDKSGSIFAWIKTDILDYWGGIVNRGGANDQNDDFGLWVGRGNVGAQFNWPDSRRRLSSKGLIPSGKWTLVGICWDDRNAVFYIDGKEEGVQSLTPADLPPRRNSRIAIGSNAAGGHEPYNGLVGSIMIYNRPLTAPEASLLYVGTKLKFR